VITRFHRAGSSGLQVPATPLSRDARTMRTPITCHKGGVERSESALPINGRLGAFAGPPVDR
jgi:hypothetical protein